jgi:sec-independent protein translocase protein TatA
MLNIHPQELLLILVVALLIVGPRRLPELGRSIGKGIRELRKAQDEVRKTIQVNLDDDQGRPTFDEHRATGRRATNGSTPAGASSAAVAGSTSTEDTREISRTLGRGLAELRKARAEIERSFRVEIDKPPRPTRGKPKRSPAPSGGDGDAAADAAAGEPDAGRSGQRSTPE